MAQLPLFGRAESPSVDAELAALERIQLDHGAWLDVARGWLRGEAEIFAQLHADLAWRDCHLGELGRRARGGCRDRVPCYK